MPKKRSYNFKQLQGSSSPQPNSSQQNGSSSSPSVNERLSSLRKLEAKDAAAKKRELADSVNQRSVPPQVQGILGVPESTPPKAKAGTRLRERLRTPGPAPPKSWLAGGSTWNPALARSLRRTGRGLKKSANVSERSRPKELLRFARLTGLAIRKDDGGANRLTHLALKAIAESWDMFDEDDYAAFTDVPLRLRLRLMSYIGFYGPTTNAAGIEALLQGTELLDHLDLSSLVGYENVTVKKIGKLLTKNDHIESGEVLETIAESWDDEESLQPSLSTPIRPNRAAHLTHLCLSQPGPGASWRDLLSFSKQSPQITHLSLAYWPWPTLTPNLATTTVSGRHGQSINAGGSDYYSALDQSLEEPATLLRQLSNHLLCLQWLDLEGCQQWSPALVELGKTPASDARSVNPVSSDDWNTQQRDAPVLATNWKNLAHVRCAQGWLPSYWGMRTLQSANAMPISAMEVLVSKGIMYHLEHMSERFTVPREELTHDQIDVEKKKARIWLLAESRISQAFLKINLARHDYACKPIEMDCGWDTIARFLRGV